MAAKETTAELYILDQPENLRVILSILHDIILEHSNRIRPTLSYGLPFYKIENNKTLCYLTIHQKKSVDITFWRGANYVKEFNQLDQRDRKLMASLNYKIPDEIDIVLIKTILSKILAQYDK